jgi:hypothetical protein
MCKSFRKLEDHTVGKGYKTNWVTGTKVFAGYHNQIAIIGLWSQQTDFLPKLPEFDQAEY